MLSHMHKRTEIFYDFKSSDFKVELRLLRRDRPVNYNDLRVEFRSCVRFLFANSLSFLKFY